ncbi:MAG: hypothetical protein LBL27_01045 [Coriobacteriales bacterium]|jgi:uncharacterized Zn finger protein (UPF0148 family)|nr:hypothetical protein [Coriobacteriales bacterium]
MAGIEVSCSQCGAGEYRLLDARTGEVACLYCRNQWIIPELVQKSETEKYLEEQAKQPRVTHDNTTETDKQLMDVVSGLVGAAGLGFLRSASRMLARFLKAIILIIVLVAIIVVALILIRIYA